MSYINKLVINRNNIFLKKHKVKDHLTYQVPLGYVIDNI